MTRTTVDMWFDPKCPWAWICSRWLLEVERVRPVTVRFHVMSLSVLNEGRTDLDAWYRAWLDDAWGPARIATAVQVEYDTAAVGRIYTALGERIHRRHEPLGPELYRAALAEAGADPELAAAADDDRYDAAMRASHHAGLAPVGEDLGTPVLHLPAADGGVTAFFGPVVTPTPRGETAGRLWDGVVLTTSTPGFFELKRGRDIGPDTTA